MVLGLARAKNFLRPDAPTRAPYALFDGPLTWLRWKSANAWLGAVVGVTVGGEPWFLARGVLRSEYLKAKCGRVNSRARDKVAGRKRGRRQEEAFEAEEEEEEEEELGEEEEEEGGGGRLGGNTHEVAPTYLAR